MDILLSNADDDEKVEIFSEQFSKEVIITAIKTQSVKLVKFLIYQCLTGEHNLDYLIISVLETENIKLIDFALSLKTKWNFNTIIEFNTLKLIQYYTNKLNREFIIETINLGANLDDLDYLKFLFEELNTTIKINCYSIRNDKTFAYMLNYPTYPIDQLIVIAAKKQFTISVDKLLLMGAKLTKLSQHYLLGCCDLLWLEKKKINYLQLISEIMPELYNYNTLIEILDTYKNYDGFDYDKFIVKIMENSRNDFYEFTRNNHRFNSNNLFEYLYSCRGDEDEQEKLIRVIIIAIERKIELSDNFLAYIKLNTNTEYNWIGKYNSFLAKERCKIIQSVIIPDLAWLIVDYL